MDKTTFSWALVALASVVTSAPALGQEPPPNYPPAPGYQPPPPNYQAPPPQYQQAPPPQYQQAPPQQYQQPPPNYQQPPPQQYQQPPPNYQQPPPQQYQQPPPPSRQQAAPAPSAAAAAVVPAYVSPPQGFQYHPWRLQIEGGYTITSGDTKQSWQDGGNVGAGITWFPSSSLPLGIRLDGSYSSFDATPGGLASASTALGTTIGRGRQDMYGGDADAEIDLPMGPRAREYVFGGVGWYRLRTSYDQVQNEYGLICYFYCYPGTFPVLTNVQRTTTDWMRAWNAGIGFEFLVQNPVSFFIEARYMRFEQPKNSNNVYIPIRVGLRF